MGGRQPSLGSRGSVLSVPDGPRRRIKSIFLLELEAGHPMESSHLVYRPNACPVWLFVDGLGLWVVQRKRRCSFRPHAQACWQFLGGFLPAVPAF